MLRISCPQAALPFVALQRTNIRSQRTNILPWQPWLLYGSSLSLNLSMAVQRGRKVSSFGPISAKTDEFSEVKERREGRGVNERKRAAGRAKKLAEELTTLNLREIKNFVR